MITNKASAAWQGDLKNGEGNMKVESGAIDAPYSFATRFEGKQGTNPDELIAAASAGCFSMAFSLELSEAGHTPESIETNAAIILDPESLSITDVKLTTKASVPDIDKETFQKIAEGAKNGCPVSKALAGTNISLDATLL